MHLYSTLCLCTECEAYKEAWSIDVCVCVCVVSLKTGKRKRENSTIQFEKGPFIIVFLESSVVLTVCDTSAYARAYSLNRICMSVGVKDENRKYFNIFNMKNTCCSSWLPFSSPAMATSYSGHTVSPQLLSEKTYQELITRQV